jgi:hypothetical protein
MFINFKVLLTILVISLFPILLIGLGAGLPDCKFPGTHKNFETQQDVPNTKGLIDGYSIDGSGLIISGIVLLIFSLFVHYINFDKMKLI